MEEGRNKIVRTGHGLLLTGVLALVASGATVLVWLWLHDGGVSGVHGGASLFTSAGRLTGLLGGYSLVIQVLLLIRLPFLEWIAGFDKLTRIHRFNGKLTLYLILAHVLAITIGYGAARNANPLSEFGTILTNYYAMVAALIGTLVLVLVVVTSLVIVRKRLVFETWYVVHLLAYVGIALTWFHETRTGLDFIANPWAATLWTGLYVVSLQLLVLFRLVQPVVRHYFHRIRVVEVKQEGPGVTTIRVAGRHLDWLNAQPGQFFLWRFLTAGMRWQTHPFSLSAAPNARSLRLSAKAVGDFTGALPKLRPGTRVSLEGPFGSLTPARRTHGGALLIAGGIGITPIRALTEVMTGNVILLYRAMSEDDLVFRDELDELGKKRGITIHYIVGDHRRPENSRLLSSDHLRRLVPGITERDVFVAGPPGMVDMIKRNLKAAGVPKAHIHSEQFALA